MKKRNLILSCLAFVSATTLSYAQIIKNKNFSLGSYGRVGVGFSPDADGNTGQQLNLNNQGSLSGRLDQGDYIEFVPAFHFNPIINKDGSETEINAQLRFSFFSGGPFIGNVNSGSKQGLVLGMPEAFVEAKNVGGTKLDVWAGSRYYRADDVHVVDYFYFDDLSTTGWGVKYKNTRFAMLFPAAVDTLASNSTPYSYTNIISGLESLTYRQKEVLALDHTIPFNDDKSSVKFLGEFHHVNATGKKSKERYPSDNGFVVGVKYKTELNTKIKGSFNHVALRYGYGIANGGNLGNTQSFRTFGAPDEETNTYKGAYSITLVEHLLWNMSSKWSLNPYFIFTTSKGGNNSNNLGKDYYGREIVNKKLEFNVGLRSTYYFNDWFHILSELHYGSRKDGTNDPASLWKLVLAPTLVPTAERSVWARPHIRLIAEVARYNDQARNTLYSPFLQQAGPKRIGTYFGVKAEWWLF